MSADPGLPTLGPCAVGEPVVVPPMPPPEFFAGTPAPSSATYYPTWEVSLKIASYVLVMMVGAIGNILVILIVSMIRRLRSTTNVYVANLAMSDVMVSLLCTWVHLGKNISPEWPFTGNMCKINNFFQAWSVTASVLFLTIIAGDRFFAIVFPFRVKRGRSCVATVLVVTTWLVSAAIAVPHLITWHLLEIQWKDRLERACVDIWPLYYYETTNGLCLSHAPSRTMYTTVHVVILYFLPIIIMTCAYVMIGRALWKRKMPGEANSKSVAIQMKCRKKVVRMLVVVLLVFFACWTPLQVMVLYDTHRPLNTSHPAWFADVKYVATFVAYSNSAINPILYGALNDNFRQGFREAFKCSLCHIKRNEIGPDMVRTTQVITVRPRTSDNSKETDGQKF